MIFDGTGDELGLGGVAAHRRGLYAAALDVTVFGGGPVAEACLKIMIEPPFLRLFESCIGCRKAKSQYLLWEKILAQPVKSGLSGNAPDRSGQAPSLGPALPCHKLLLLCAYQGTAARTGSRKGTVLMVVRSFSDL